MRALGAALGAGLLAATFSCGGQDGPATPDAAAYHGCSLRSLKAHGAQVARADLDGDGRDESVRLVGSGRCAGSLVVAQGQTPIGVDVRALDLVTRRAEVVHLRGGSDLVLMRSRVDSSGLYQPHLFGQVGTRVREVTRARGAPVLPRVRNRGPQAPHAARCTPDGGIEVTESTTHRPPGIVLAWDVTTTTYDVHAGRAVVRRTKVLTMVAEPVLRRQRPDLYAGGLLDDCV